MPVKRPRQLPVKAFPSSERIERASYVGSAEHKIVKWWGGLPKAYVGADGTAQRSGRQKTTICPLVTKSERAKASLWVRNALEARQGRFLEGDKNFPKHIWYEDENGQIWFGFCMNGILGEYKGWPIDRNERDEFFR